MVRAERRLGRAGGAAAEQENRRVVERQRHGGPRRIRMLAHQVVPRQVARLQLDAVALLLLLGQGKQQAQVRRQVFFDVRRDHAADLRARLQRLDLVIEGGQDDDRFRADLVQRVLQLARACRAS